MIRDLSFSPIMIMNHNREYNFVHTFIYYIELYTYNINLHINDFT